MSSNEIIAIIVQLLGGLALFLYGMSILGRNLEKVSGGHLEKVLEKLTSNIFLSVLLGALVTAAVQSSSVTTVIVVGLVNAGILKLSSAVGVIMGANIGTTITGQILRLGDLENNESLNSFMNFLTPKMLAPFLALVGMLLFMIAKRDKIKIVGEVFIALGVLFTGLLSMTAAVKPLSELETFRRVFESMSNPILGILAGLIVTVIIQSSSASVGILQAISTTGVLTFASAFPIIMGQNIGTCITPILASVGAGKNAKRSAMIHVWFNVIGTIFFLIVIYAIQYTIGLSFWSKAIDMGGIANFHTFFNICVTLLLLPFNKLLVKLASWTIKEKAETIDTEESTSEQAVLATLEDRLLKSPFLAIQQANSATLSMGKLACSNYKNVRKLFDNFDVKLIEKIKTNEDSIDRMEDRLNAYLIKLTECELSDIESRRVTLLLHLVNEFERIGDYAVNILETAESLKKNNVSFSESAMAELNVIASAVEEIINMAIETVSNNDVSVASSIEPLEEVIDYLNETLKSRHIERLKQGKCVVESGISFLDILINLERISDHCSNIAVYIIGNILNQSIINRHEYIQAAHKGENKEYIELSDTYMSKYAL